MPVAESDMNSDFESGYFVWRGKKMKVLCVEGGPGGKVGSWRSGSETQLTHQSRKVKRR